MMCVNLQPESFQTLVGPTPSSGSATSSPLVSMAPLCPTCTTMPEGDAAPSPTDVTAIAESDCRDEGMTLNCSGGGAVVAAVPPPRGLGCRGGGAWACTICCSRGGGGVFCLCCSGGGWRDDGAAVAVTDTPPEGSGVCLMMIFVTVGGLGVVLGGGAWGLMAPVRERVVTCGRSRMMLEVQMLVMVFSSGL